MTRRVDGGAGEPTVADVALAAGVSKSTAARVLGGYGAAGARAKQQVERAAAQLGYRPNGFARGMNTGRSNTIGVVHAGVENPVFAVALRGISDVAERHDMTVVMISTNGLVDAERRAVQTLLDRRVDGLIVCPADGFDIEHLQAVRDRGIPLVLWERRLPALRVPVVEASMTAVMRDLVEHLVDLGHRRVAYISTARTKRARYAYREDIGYTIVTDRLDTMIEVQRHRLGTDSADLIRFARSVTAEEVVARTREVFETTDPPTALITSDSEIALAAVPELERLGLRIGRDVSLVTFDDVGWALLTTPKTTVVAQPTYEMGRTAAEAVVRLRSGEQLHTPLETFNAVVRWRGSVTAPAAGVAI